MASTYDHALTIVGGPSSFRSISHSMPYLKTAIKRRHTGRRACIPGTLITYIPSINPASKGCDTTAELGRQEHCLSIIEPVIRHIEPVIRHIEPVIRHIEPVIRHIEPVIRHIEPVIRHIEPVIRHIEPVIRHIEPVIRHIEPVIRHCKWHLQTT